MKNKLFLIFALLLFIFSCKNKADQADLSIEEGLFSEYFTAATTGIISAGDNLKFILRYPVDAEMAEEDLQKVIKLEPKTSGQVTLSHDNILTFTPDELLKPGSSYTVNLDMNAFNTQDLATKLSYKVQTMEQEMDVENNGILIDDSGKTSVILKVNTADVAHLDLLKSCFSSDGKVGEVSQVHSQEYEVAVRWDAGLGLAAHIKYDGKNIGSSAKGEVPITSFDKNKFQVILTKFDREKSLFNIYFSQLLKENDDLTGLLTINGRNPSFSIANNVMSVFLGGSESGQNEMSIKLSKGLKSRSGTALNTDYTFKNTDFDDLFGVNLPEVRFVGDGNYFPSEGDFKIPIKARGLTKVRLMVLEIEQSDVPRYLRQNSLDWPSDFYNLKYFGESVFDEVVELKKGARDNDGWSVYGIDLSGRMKRNPGNIYFISVEMMPEFVNIPCKDMLKKFDIRSRLPDPEYFKYSNYDYRGYYYSPDYDWSERNNPCDISYYIDKEPESRMFICSDFSVIAKKAGQSYYVAVNKLIDLSPVSGASVTLYNLQSKVLSQANTSSSGMVVFTDMDEDASVLKISKGNSMTFLSLDPAQSNSLTEFNIEGERSEAESEFFVWLNRGVYRPGEDIDIDIMINKENLSIPDGVPITLTFYNTDNYIIDKQVQSLQASKNLIYTFKVKTNPEAKTGVYRCAVTVGSKSVKKEVRIETIKPNIAETIYSFDNFDNNTIYSDFISGTIHSKYLTGFDLADAKVKATARGWIPNNPFPEHSDYHFGVYTSFKGDNIPLFNLETDSKGAGKFKSDHSLAYYNSPFVASIETETLLPGGGANKEGKTVNVSPLGSYIGVKRSQGSGWYGNYVYGDDIKLHVINLDRKGQAYNRSNTVKYTIAKNVKSWWVDKYSFRSEGNFMNDYYWEKVSEKQMNISGNGTITINKNSLEMGAYRVIIEDMNSGHKVHEIFTVYDGREIVTGNQPHILEFEVDKETYTAGDKVNISLPGIKDAKALVSVERNNQIIEQKWFDLDKTKKTVSMSSEESWAPNVYLHVTVVQRYNQENNDLPLRMYGVKYIKLTGKTPPLTPLTNLPDKMQSASSQTFTVSEKNGKPMEYIIAVVDEGVLNLTGFNTADPMKHFQGKYPLLVNTWDVYKYLLSYFKGRYAGIISIGGDNVYNPDAIAEINRFKPVSLHYGPYKLNAGKKQTHTLKLPEYLGKVRVMIIAVNEDNFGNYEKQIEIKNPLFVQSQIPRSLNVTDKFKLPVSIFRDDKSISGFSIQAKSGSNLIKGLTSQKNLTFSKGDQLTHLYDIEVENKVGVARMDFTVSSGKNTMTESTDVLVNYPHSYETESQGEILEPGQTMTIKVTPKGYPEVFTSNIIISGLKLPSFARYYDDLIEYPYGCLEQITSRGLALLFMDKIIALPADKRRKRNEYLAEVVRAIGQLQQAGGKFNYWDNGYYHGWSDVYAGNLLTEMNRLDEPGNYTGMLDKWLTAQSKAANDWALSESSTVYTYEYESMVQAFRLYVMSKAGKPALSALNRFTASNKAQSAVTWWLIAGSFELAGHTSQAKQYADKASNAMKNYEENWSYMSFGSRARDLSIITEIMTVVKPGTSELSDFYNSMVDELNSQSWASTQMKGFAFEAAYKYYNRKVNTGDKINYTINGLTGGVQSESHSPFNPKYFTMVSSDYNKDITIKNEGKGPMYINRQNRYIDNNIQIAAKSKNLNLKVSYYNESNGTAGLENVSIGDNVVVTVTVENLSIVDANNLALNLKMPSGWELLNPRLYKTDQMDTKNSNLVYQDYRDDRVYTFFYLNAGRKTSFNFRIKAAYSGDFYLPETLCEDMYFGGAFTAKTASGRTIVK